MKVRIPIHSIPALDSCSRLVHGISPRCLEREDGTIEPLRLGRDDQPDVSRDHKRWLLQSLGIERDALFLLKQTHSDRVVVIDRDKMTPAQVGMQEGDALVTHLKDTPVGVMTADCVPVIVYDRKVHAVGVVHAGRRGTQQGILTKTLDAMKVVYGSRPEQMMVGLGPAIGPCCYEVDEDCVAPFRERGDSWRDFATPGQAGKYWLDLWTANRMQAERAGIAADRIHVHGGCTACHTDRWFSYRKEGQTGRMITLAMLK
ncbi:peptidoglycan editing factor PgeF [Nitrospina watsonii]|uniref:Purine nucleoside phosphorylase n=1 Tax=Nitrospina watsonii TaxID=1323948 RepID=A0ABM9HB45_9BACT|nr:peptidoglycan editing factor PgeF [Nitrospina watsonii]CAI2717337.1 Purine nucleoside phosphorylase [Nitrospina watsonii]